MFLVTLTHLPVGRVLKDCKVQQFDLVSSKILTLVTDNFLSTSTIAPRTFSVIETPFVDSPHPRQETSSKIIIDGSDNSVQMFRSTMSGRPIYYHINYSGELFCSSHISLLRKVGVPIEENSDVLPEFFVYRYVMPPRTLFKNIQQVAAGSHVHCRFRNGKNEIVKLDQYHPPAPKNAEVSNNIYDVARRTLSILSDTIQPLIKTTERTAFLLSGGLDSSILFKACHNSFDIDATFSTGYPIQNSNFNLEKTYAYSAAESFATKHFYHEATVEDYLSGFLEAVSAAEEPLHHLQSVLLYLLFKKGVPCSKDIVVSGEGADSIFGSGLASFLYRSDRKMFKIMSLSPLSKLVDFASHASLRAGYLATGLRNMRKKHLPLSDPDSVIWQLGAYGSFGWASLHFGVGKEDIISGRYESMRAFENRSLYDVLSLLGFLGDVSITTALWSKLGEHQKRILYYPFTDVSMLDYAYGIPWDLKLKQPKNILRYVATELKIARFIVDRPKSGFGIGPENWAVRGGWFEPLIGLAAKVFPKKQIEDLQSISLDKASTFWNVLNYSLWKRLVINNEPLEFLRGELEEISSRLRRFPNNSCQSTSDAAG